MKLICSLCSLTQLLDLTVGATSSFKGHYNTDCSQWILNHAGSPVIAVYDIAECVGNAYLPSFTPKNIIPGLQVPEIYLFN